jgi:xylose isomerase
MTEFFPGIPGIKYEGPDSPNPLSFKHYDANAIVMGKPMRDHLRFAVCFWHSFKGLGQDMFGGPTISRAYETAGDPMKVAEDTIRAAFEFFTKLGVGFWCFHDRDIAPEADTLAETNRRLDRIVDLAEQLQRDTGVSLLWGTANLFSHRRFMSGAATSPHPAVFAFAASQVKKALEITQRLGGRGYVFWGGREGYETLLNTDLRREMDNYARFLHGAVDYAGRIGFTGQFYIEPKPKEPAKHQYDSDAAACHAFLQKYGLVEHFKLNIEANHATLAGHSFHHELEYAAANGLLGSIDANRGDLLLGWDTDQFPTDLYDTTLAMCTLLRAGGFQTGGLNFDAKVRRTSIDPEDLFHAHIGGMDAFARGLKAAAKMAGDGTFEKAREARYADWDSELGKRIESGMAPFAELEKFTLEHGEPEVRSARQEYLENLFNQYL